MLEVLVQKDALEKGGKKQDRDKSQAPSPVVKRVTAGFAENDELMKSQNLKRKNNIYVFQNHRCHKNETILRKLPQSTTEKPVAVCDLNICPSLSKNLSCTWNLE